MLVAYIDDSIGRRSERRLFLAGYLTRVDVWELFSAAWRAELARSPAIESFHMVEAQNLRGPFKGWSREARDAKVIALARLVRAFPLFSFECSVSTIEYKKYFGDSAPFGMAKPYGLCAQAVSSGLARHFYAEGFRDPIRFVFDTQEGADVDLTTLWPWIRASSRGPWRRLLGPPEFADDRDAVPLQAADLLVWHIRRVHDGTDAEGALPAAGLVHGDLHLASEIDDERLAHVGRKIARVPGVRLLRSKSDWRQARNSIAKRHRLGLGPPKLGPHSAFAIAWIKQMLRRFRT